MINTADITAYVKEAFPRFGVNKRQEIARLLFEIAKRDDKDFKKILPAALIQQKRFFLIKQRLIKKRFPLCSAQERNGYHWLPALHVESHNQAKIRRKLLPTNPGIFVEEAVSKTDLAKRFKQRFPKAQWQVISAYSDYKKQKIFGIDDYNQRLQKIFIVREKFDFFQRCPCSSKSVRCGYYVMNLGVGCPYECAYCFLQGYVNSPGIVFPANIEDFFDQFERTKTNIRLGTGEFTDSLVYDSITQYSPLIIDFFKSHPQSTFEFKTKSDNIKTLLSAKPGNNIFVSWSLNPQNVIDAYEPLTVSLKRRLLAARRCVNAGFQVGFHFDPIIFSGRWDKDYHHLVENLFQAIGEKDIGWISLGTLRMVPKLKSIIENRFPQTHLLDGEFLLGYDDKLRYSFSLRKRIYSTMKRWIRKHSRKVPIYLCMEEMKMYESCRIPPFSFHE